MSNTRDLARLTPLPTGQGVYTWNTPVSGVGLPGWLLTTTDNIQEGTANLYYTGNRVRQTTLSTFTTPNTAIAVGDQFQPALGKLQGQINQALTVGFNDFGTQTNGTDWNTYTIRGLYHFLVETPLASANRPTDSGGVLNVMFWGGSNASVYQIYYAQRLSTMWTRSLSGGTWSAWVSEYHTGNAVGTVSQTSGVPTGAIVETGTNANGTYTKWADGTMVCNKTVSFGTTTFATEGNSFVSNILSGGATAATFVSISYASAYLLGGNGLVWHSGGTPATMTAHVGVYGLSTRSGSTTITGSYTAWGRWY